MTDPTLLSATELAAAIRARRLSAGEVMRAYLQRIERVNPGLNAIAHLAPERALAAAARADARAPSGCLHGVPMTLKDSHRVAGMPTRVGHPDAPRAAATRNGFVAARLRAEGALIIGKTNVARDLGDFQTDNAVSGRTNNPWDPSRTPGGSSGGAAAALAARLTPLEVGSDIAGSVRLPAAFCGVIGLKPGADLISRRGHVTEPAAHPRGGGVGALASIGPMARGFDDIGLLLDVLAGPQPTATFEPRSSSIGVIPRFPRLPVEASIAAAIDSLADDARRRGLRVDLVEPPAHLVAQHRAWVDVYAAAGARGAGWRTPALARRRHDARAAWGELLRRHDAILLPAVMCVAFPHRPTGTPIEVDGEPVPYWRLSAYLEPFNLTGLPALAFPVGADAGGLPIGLQLVAAEGRERWLVRAAAWLAAAWVVQTPPPDIHALQARRP